MQVIRLATLALGCLALPAWADDTWNIVGTVTLSDVSGSFPGEPTINIGDQWFGTLTTDGVCQICYDILPTNGMPGGLTSLDMLIFGDFENTGTPDNPQNVFFDRHLRTLNFIDSAGPAIDIQGGGFVYEFPNLGQDEALGTVLISKAGASVPEPSTFGLLGTTLFASVWFRRRKRGA